MSKLLSTLICGNVTSIIFAIYFTKDTDLFISHLYGITYLVFLGLFLLVFPFSFLIEKIVNKLDIEIGKAFIEFGFYIIVGVIGMVLVLPLLFQWSFMAVVVAAFYLVILKWVEKISKKHGIIGVIISSIFTLLMFLFLYNNIA
ncbi:hypothetical protein J0K78_02835 [Halobacillus sp. GSS1]|uniref:hypothetical protein n=1 Tax=Halobacillus sp. GSS1 TaxID=2815919 RepID=UPI001A8C50DD|nr:hypothetical protein [Halobacillus sp. GSS1]MBN9653189.1 hypothetical protein [Halobacillus sp. GSS1]